MKQNKATSEKSSCRINNSYTINHNTLLDMRKEKHEWNVFFFKFPHNQWMWINELNEWKIKLSTRLDILFELTIKICVCYTFMRFKWKWVNGNGLRLDVNRKHTQNIFRLNISAYFHLSNIKIKTEHSRIHLSINE